MYKFILHEKKDGDEGKGKLSIYKRNCQNSTHTNLVICIILFIFENEII